MSQGVPPPPLPPPTGYSTSKKPLSLMAILIIVGGILLVCLLICSGLLFAIAAPSFLRAREISRRNACQENLSRIDGAKQQWALEKQIDDPTVVPTWDDLLADGTYLKQSPSCPSSGTYTINDLVTDPTCSLETQPQFPHLFPRTQQ